jgi:hypothetical protein
MSQIKPSILVNPKIATNGMSSDTQQAGWYQVSPNSSSLALRVNNSNIGISGEIQLNTTVNKFQGYNGTVWVDLNATQGPTGTPGKDFTNAVNFNNLGSNTATSTIVPLGSVFSTTFANVAASISNVNIRSLQGGNYTVNSNLSVNSMVLSQNSNIITLTSQPLPYTWDFTNDRNTVSYLKNAPSDTNNYGFGETSKWIVKTGVNVFKGQAVRLTNDSISSSNIVITPITYTTLVGMNSFTNNNPFNILGIATQTATGGNTCIVCTKGITSVLCNNTTNIPTGSGFSPSNNIPYVGALGIIGTDGLIFCNINNVPTTEYISAGYFIDKDNGEGLATSGNYALFYVQPSIRNF